jgi:hypothetical protein
MRIVNGARILRNLVASALLIVFLRNAEAQSTNLLKAEKRRAATNPLDTSDQAVSLSGAFYLERSSDSFGIRCHGIVERTSSGSRVYPLPQSNIETFRRLRAADLKYMSPHLLTAKEYQGQEVIGPYQVEGSRIWFGNQYYDGEGDRGVGAFGYFDMKTRKYVLFSPLAIARWEVSALFVQPDAIWLALDHFGEDISTSPGGLIRWDRNDHRVRRYPLEFVVTQVRHDTTDPATLFLTTPGGYALFRNGAVQRFRVQKSPNGKEHVGRIDRFPPLPSIQ